MQSPFGTFDRNSAMLVVSCSDARLTPEDSQSSWKSRLDFDGQIFEFRCPGGGIALADEKSVFYKSALETFRLLGMSHPLNYVVLSFHEDCAYFNEKYGSDGAGSAKDRRRKFHLADEAIENVVEWSPTIDVVPYYIDGLVNRDAARPTMRARETQAYRERHTGQDGVVSRETARPTMRARETQAYRERHAGHFCDHDHEHGAQREQPLREEPTFPIHQRATLRSLDRQIEDRILRSDISAEQIVARAEGEVRETGAIPPWHVERRAREFLELLERSGSMKADKLKASVRSFIQNYAGDSLTRGSLRAISDELNAHMQGLRSSRSTG
jgi:hypothetical protein